MNMASIAKKELVVGTMPEEVKEVKESSKSSSFSNSSSDRHIASKDMPPIKIDIAPPSPLKMVEMDAENMLKSPQNSSGSVSNSSGSKGNKPVKKRRNP